MTIFKVLSQNHSYKLLIDSANQLATLIFVSVFNRFKVVFNNPIGNPFNICDTKHCL